jgi:hypothetical protein
MEWDRWNKAEVPPEPPAHRALLEELVRWEKASDEEAPQALNEKLCEREGGAR